MSGQPPPLAPPPGSLAAAACLPAQHANPPACRVAFKPDTKVANAGTFTVQREDHTVGNLVRM